jgi:hypothetical protein
MKSSETTAFFQNQQFKFFYNYYYCCSCPMIMYRGRILGRNWDKSLRSFPPCFSQSSLLTDFTPHPPSERKSWLKLVCNLNIVYENIKSESSQEYAQKTQRNCTFMNLASVRAQFVEIYLKTYFCGRKTDSENSWKRFLFVFT